MLRAGDSLKKPTKGTLKRRNPRKRRDTPTPQKSPKQVPSHDEGKRPYMYVFGGDGSVTDQPSVERYDLREGNWERLQQPMPTTEFGISITMYQGVIWLLGGQDSTFAPMNKTYGYDAVHDEWNKQKEMTQPRSYLGTAELCGKLFAVGGQYALTDFVEAYDEENEWQKYAPMNVKRSRFGIGVAGSRLYAVGGRGENNEAMRSAEYFSFESRQWTNVCNMDKPRRDFQLVTGDYMLYAVGGDEDGSVEFFNGAPRDTWGKMTNCPIVRKECTVGSLRDCFFVLGGIINGSCTNMVNAYNPRKHTWITLKGMEEPRSGATAAILEV